MTDFLHILPDGRVIVTQADCCFLARAVAALELELDCLPLGAITIIITATINA